jgi:hypothetical protein
MKNIDRLLREVYPPELPLGFAERTARAAMEPASGAFWDLVLGMTPRVSIALGAVATALVAIGFVGSGPGLLDAIGQYAHIGSILSIP